MLSGDENLGIQSWPPPGYGRDVVHRNGGTKQAASFGYCERRQQLLDSGNSSDQLQSTPLSWRIKASPA